MTGGLVGLRHAAEMNAQNDVRLTHGACQRRIEESSLTSVLPVSSRRMHFRCIRAASAELRLRRTFNAAFYCVLF